LPYAPQLVVMVKVIVIILIGVIALIAQMKYFIRDDRTENNSARDKDIKLKWHFAGGVIHGWMYYVIADNYGIEWGLLISSLTWIFFDGFINAELKKEFFYVGETALIDKAQRQLAKILHLPPDLVSALLKLALVIITLYFFIQRYG